MKKSMTLFFSLLFLFASCKKDDKKEAPQKPAPQVKKPAKKIEKTPCEKAFNTFVTCVDKTKLKEKGSYLDECRKWSVGKNELLKNDIMCWAKADGNCKLFEACLPKKDKALCEVFADTRMKCRRNELKDKVATNFRASLVAQCTKETASADSAFKTIYKCFAEAREVCAKSKPCFKKLDVCLVLKAEEAKKALEKRFKKLSRKEKKQFNRCVNHHRKCVKEFKDKELARERCKELLFSESKIDKKRIACIYRLKNRCAKVEKCAKK